MPRTKGPECGTNSTVIGRPPAAAASSRCISGSCRWARGEYAYIALRRSGIRRLFVLEGLLLGLFGAAAGVAVALGVAALINHSGLTWLPPGQVDPVPLTVHVWGEARMILGTAAGLTLVAVLSAWWPARRAARMQIVDALRHV
jgi:putative ABC transport system permease protein